MIKLDDGIDKSENILSISNLAPTLAFEYDNLSDVVKTILISNHRRIPIISKNGKLTGIITYMDILHALLTGFTKNTQVTEFMTREVIYCESYRTIGDALKKMQISKRGGIPIVTDEKLAGIINERDFARLIEGKYLNIEVEKIMSHKPISITLNSSIQTAMKTMINIKYRRLTVLDGKEIVGIVTGIDILRFLQENNYNHLKLDENISSIMSTPVKYVMKHQDSSEIVKIILANNIGGLPVVNEMNHLVGIVTERNLVEIL